MIAVDATYNGWVASASSLTYAHTVTGANAVLVVGSWMFNSSATFSSCTYNGVSMTNLVNRTTDGTGGDIRILGLANPATGSNNVVITCSSSKQIFGNSVSYTGVDQTTPFPDTGTSGSSSGTSFSISITTTVDQSWVFACVRSPSRVPTAGADTVVRQTNPISGDAGWEIDSNAGRSVGSNALNYSYSPSQTSYWTMISIAPSVDATFVPKVAMFM